MNLVYKTSFFIIIILFSVNSFSQKDTIHEFGDVHEEVEYYFGFNLIESAGGGLCHFAIVKPLPNGKLKIVQITMERFINQAAGKQSSKANPKNINFFEEYKIQDTYILNDLWKLRYLEYPLESREKMDKGWSTNDSIPFLPTDAQIQILNKFGMKRLSDYIYGENAFKLLYNMTVDQWVTEYKESY